jgi:opacity protein-like surface antigen
MPKFLACAASAAVLILAAHAADTAAPRKPLPAAPGKTPAAPRTAPKPAATSSGARNTTTTTRRTTTPAAPRRPVTTWRNRQAVPTPERYKEIQEALASKGYLQPEDASGHWDQASIEALKKFQADEKLDSTGKLNSLSLIALGLGPKYEAPAAATPAMPAMPTVSTTTVAPPAESH